MRRHFTQNVGTVLLSASTLHCHGRSQSSSPLGGSDAIVMTRDGVPTSDAIKSMLRVDLAGERAAVRICKTQLFWMSPMDPAVSIVKEILEEEIEHREKMKELSAKYEAPETVLDPIFKAGAIAMGTVTAALGKDAIMCCHAAVEIVIAEHYNDQLRELGCGRDTPEGEKIEPLTTRFGENTSESPNADPIAAPQQRDIDAEVETRWKDLKETIAKFRDDEEHHQHLGESNGASNAPFYPVLYNGIKAACNVGIFFAKRL